MGTDDLELLTLYVTDRDAEAMSELIRRHRNMVYAVCCRVLGDASDAEDAAQECFLQLARSAGTIRTSVGGWLHRVAVRTAAAALREERSRRHRERQAMEMAVACDEDADWERIKPEVDRAIDRLPEKLRTPLVLYFLEGRDQAAIAAELRLSQPAVSRRVSKAVEHVRRHLRDAGVIVSAAALASLLTTKTTAAAPAALVADLGRLSLAGLAPEPASVGAGAHCFLRAVTAGWKAKVAYVAIVAVIVPASLHYAAQHRSSGQQHHALPEAAAQERIRTGTGIGAGSRPARRGEKTPAPGPAGRRAPSGRRAAMHPEPAHRQLANGHVSHIASALLTEGRRPNMNSPLRALALTSLLSTAGIIPVVPALAQPSMGEFHVAEGKVVSEGLKPITTSASDDKFRFTTMGGVECLRADIPNSSWLRIALDQPLSADWKGPVTVGVCYFDDAGQLQLQYDSSDPTRVYPPWAWSPIQWRHGSKTWKAAYWTIEKPGFTHREFGSDFGLRGGGGGFEPPFVAGMSVTRAGLLLSAKVPGLALGDKQSAPIAAKVFGPDGQPAPDGTKVSFSATLGRCTPEQAKVAGGEVSTVFTPFDKAGEAVIFASCDFTTGQMRLPLVMGTGGVREVDWVVDDFEAPNASLMAGLTSGVRGLKATVEVLPEAARSGRRGGLLTYTSNGESDEWKVVMAHPVPLPGVILRLDFWAKMSEPGVELHWMMCDAGEERWTFAAPSLEKDDKGWVRYGSTTVDPYPTHGDAVLDYPLEFIGVIVTRSPWSKANAGTLMVDDIVAKLLVANSEVEKLGDRVR